MSVKSSVKFAFVSTFFDTCRKWDLVIGYPPQDPDLPEDPSMGNDVEVRRTRVLRPPWGIQETQKHLMERIVGSSAGRLFHRKTPTLLD